MTTPAARIEARDAYVRRMMPEGRDAPEAEAALIHVFEAEAALAAATDDAVRAIRTVGVIGAGTMGTGITLALLAGGLDVVLVEPREDARARSVATIERTLAAGVERNRMTADDAAAQRARLAPDTAIAAVAGADLVIEAVFEEMDVKHAVFAALDGVVSDDAILASNTSTLDIDAIAAPTRRPERVLGMHFFSPANIMRLLEVVRGARTAPGVLAAVLALARRIRKVGIVAGVCDGFIGNRMLEEYLRQAYLLLEEGASVPGLDTALERWGMAMGPLRMMDMAGQDVGWAIRKRRAAAQPDRPYSRVPDLVCERGRFGQKTGAGLYLYPDGRRPVPDPEVEAMIAAHAAEIGVARRAVDDEEVVSRTILALVNEGARVLEEGIAARPSDIDLVYLNGYGFPAWRGGPMHYADRIGLPRVLATIERLAAGREGWAWEPAPLLLRLVEQGRTFSSL